MRVVHERCCGLDVHKKTATACVITPEGQESRAFGTMTKDLLQLGDWLIAKGVSHVAMESTAFYWKPVYNVLEGLGLELLVVNAYHIKTVPGRKTDVKDAEWIADLLRHGLLRGSYIPDRPQRELRELVRYRKGLVRQRVQVVNRIEKVLEGANIKLSAVATDIVGLSGRAMLDAMVAGEEDASTLAELARGRLRRKQADLEEALRGAVGPHQRFLLASLLRHLSFLDEEVRHADEEVESRMRPFEDVLQRLDTIPGVGRRAADQVVAEIGLDMNRFPTAGHLASWARVCPGNNESAGKRLSGCTGRGNPWLRAVLVEAAWPAARSRNTYLSSQYHRLAARRGGKRAVLAVAHTILVIVYHLIKDGMTYRELGANYFDERQREATVRRSVRRLHRLGYRVTLEAT